MLHVQLNGIPLFLVLYYCSSFNLVLDYLWNNMGWFYWFYMLFECKFNGTWQGNSLTNWFVYLTISSSKHMLREYILIPRLFYYTSNESIFDCNISLFLTLRCLYIYWSYCMLLDQMWRQLFQQDIRFHVQ